MKDALTTALDRQTLYELVWSKPTAYLAHEYGISDTALAKMCQHLDVPKPPRGYWAKVRRGQLLSRPPLPSESASSRAVPSAEPSPQRTVSPSLSACGSMPTELQQPHALVARTASGLKHRAAGPDGIVAAHGEGVLNVQVAPSSQLRALLVMDMLLKALELRGHRIAISSDSHRDTVVTIGGEPIGLRLRERLIRSAHAMTADERKQFLKYGREPYTKYDYRPSGELRLSVCRLDFRGTDSSWSDGGKKLQDQIETIVVGLEALADHAAEARRRWEEEARRREAERRRAEEDAKRFERLRQDAAAWRETRLLRRYLRALEAAVPEERRDSALRDSITWARERIERHDPLQRISE